MRVRDCEQCSYYCRASWCEKYYPKNYHAIGMTHAYGYCKRFGKPCRRIKNCEPQRATFDEEELLYEAWERSAEYMEG